MALSFKAQIEQELNAIFKKANKAVEKVSKSSWQVAVTATRPWDTGRARNGWRLNTGRKSGLIPSMGAYSGNPGVPKFSFDIRKDSLIQIFNNVPYISYIEHGQGNHKPHRMLYKASVHFEYNMQREFNKIR